MEHDPTDVALEDEAAHLRQLAAERAREILIGDFKWLMSNKRGRRYVHWQLEQARVFHQTFVPGDPLSTAFNEGRRSLGLADLDLALNHAPEQYALMLSEANDHRRTRD